MKEYTYHHVIFRMIVNRFIVNALYRIHRYFIRSFFCTDPELILLQFEGEPYFTTRLVKHS